MSAPPNPRRDRIVELALAVVGAVATSAVVTSITIPTSLARFDERISGHDRQIASTVAALASTTALATSHQAAIAELRARQAGDDQFREELNRRLDRIELLQAKTYDELRKH